MRIDHLDHLVLTVADIDVTCDFYRRVLGMERIDHNGRTALRFGVQKINLHQKGQEFEPKAHRPTPGSGDLCFIADTPLDVVQAYLADCGVALVEGPVERSGATGTIRSVYLRDPDRNLIEVANYVDR
jgi:catechol 2,3-dioxygenase-like lactoylglutathione lyase family enzyme